MTEIRYAHDTGVRQCALVNNFTHIWDFYMESDPDMWAYGVTRPHWVKFKFVIYAVQPYLYDPNFVHKYWLHKEYLETT